MFFVYILKNKDGRMYIGYTSNLTKRFKEHNSGLVRSTKAYIPWRCFYYEAYIAKSDAIKRESNLKLRARALRKLLKRIEASAQA